MDGPLPGWEMQSSEATTLCPRITTGACAAILCLAVAAEAGGGKLYRWVDDEGNVHFTDRMPADETDKEHAVMDESGAVLEEKETLEEERAQRADREAKEAAEGRSAEERRQAREEQRRADRVILRTFTTERDIHLTREDRVGAIEVQIRFLDHGIEQLQQNRASEVEQYQRFGEGSVARQGVRKRIDEIDARLAHRLEQRRSLVEQREQIESKFAHYLRRFRELNREE